MTSPTCSLAAGRVYLAVSFGGPGGSLALATSAWTAEINWEKKATSSELATLKLGELLASRELKLQDVTHILVNVGPGSFTGIRVGVNLARSLAYALDRPVAAVNALQILAQKYGEVNQSILIATHALQTHYYAAAFARDANGLTTTMAPQSMERGELDQHPATQVLIEGVAPDFDPHVSALDLVRARVQLPGMFTFFSWRELNPLYVRGSEAEEKMKKGLLKPL